MNITYIHVLIASILVLIILGILLLLKKCYCHDGGSSGGSSKPAKPSKPVKSSNPSCTSDDDCLGQHCWKDGHPCLACTGHPGSSKTRFCTSYHGPKCPTNNTCDQYNIKLSNKDTFNNQCLTGDGKKSCNASDHSCYCKGPYTWGK